MDDRTFYDVTRSLGTVTAYKYAQLGGYTGTEEDFMRALALYPQLADGTEEAAEEAIAARDDAVSIANEIANYISIGENVVSEAGTFATQAIASADRANSYADQANAVLNLIRQRYPGVTTRADVLNLFGYEEIQVAMKDTGGNDITVSLIGLVNSGVDDNAIVGTAIVGNAVLLT